MTRKSGVVSLEPRITLNEQETVKYRRERVAAMVRTNWADSDRMKPEIDPNL